mmetsp:Transcript_4718/g.16447  ORF Transcript_4718/g.16447 Transcript_4718/m.16447 type:complete len:348 (-) Transcript_4718:331-1374(-)
MAARARVPSAVGRRYCPVTRPRHASSNSAAVRGEARDVEVASPQHIHVADDFFTGARELREVFDACFEDPLQVSPRRFVWDWWHVPGQYTCLRTPAPDFFEPAPGLLGSLEESLVSFGRRELGCSAISPVWMSAYVDGCEQELHADVPHGPWAFVLSLTPWEARRFSGGETFLLEPSTTLDYWRGFDPAAVYERGDLVTEVEPLFNRLTVFDARVPHGVRPVRGTRDVREARVVLHGWFTEPSPHVEGALSEGDAAPVLNGALLGLQDQLGELPVLLGMAAARLTVSEGGVVEGLEWLSDSLVPHPCEVDPGAAREMLLGVLTDQLAGCEFPAAAGRTTITVPFMFE